MWAAGIKGDGGVAKQMKIIAWLLIQFGCMLMPCEHSWWVEKSRSASGKSKGICIVVVREKCCYCGMRRYPVTKIELPRYLFK